MGKYGVVLALLALVIFGAVTRQETFLRPENLRNVLVQSAAIGIIAVGMTLVIVAKGIDLSVGSLVALSGAVTVMLFNRLIGQGWAEGQAVAVGCLAGVGVGLAGGAVSGALVTIGRVTPFIATLGGLVGYRSITLAIAEGGEVRSASSKVFPAIGNEGVPLSFLRDGAGQPLLVNWSVFAFVAVAAAGAFTLRRTVFGRNCVAVGANEEAARLAGVGTGVVKFATYAGLGLLCGLAAVFVAGRLNSVSSSQVGNFYELDAIAAVAIGGTNMAGGKGTVVGTVLGVLIMAVISNLIQLHGVSPYWQGLVKGAIILLAVLLQRGRTEA